MIKVILSEIHNSFHPNEENLMATYHWLSVKLRVGFLSKFIKPGQEFSHESLSFLISIFNPEVHFFIRVLSQILGLENDKLVSEGILGF